MNEVARSDVEEDSRNLILCVARMSAVKFEIAEVSGWYVIGHRRFRGHVEAGEQVTSHEGGVGVSESWKDPLEVPPELTG